MRVQFARTSGFAICATYHQYF